MADLNQNQVPLQMRDPRILEIWELEGGRVSDTSSPAEKTIEAHGDVDFNIGISEEQRTKIALGLSHLLADSYSLYLKSQVYHWNVTGPFFAELHKQFQKQYEELGSAIDTIAERIRALGFPAPGGFNAFSKLTSLKEASTDFNASQMMSDLLEGHQIIIRRVRALLSVVVAAKDEATLDLLITRLHVHEKTAWILRSSLRTE